MPLAPQLGYILERVETPKWIGRYEVRQQIAHGGHSVVYEAHDPELDRTVAIKHLTPDALESGKANLARFRREARALAKLDHPNVVKLYGGGEHNGSAFLVMELVDGKNLWDWLSASPVSSRIVEVIIEAGYGLAAAHNAGIIHRDFKPENVMIGRGRVLVLDFGLARRNPTSPDSVARHPKTVSFMTEPGSILGTPEYMAPEQHLAGVADARTDQFAYCVTFYEALYGERPFVGATAAQLLRAMAAGPTRRPPRPSVLSLRNYRALARGLSIEPEARWPSMDALLEELTRPEDIGLP